MKHLLLIALLLATGCATYLPATEKKVENERTLAIPFDDAWGAVVSYVSSKGMNVKTIDKASGLITFERAYDPSFASSYLDCGRMKLASESSKDEPGKSDPKTIPVSSGNVSLSFYFKKRSAKETTLRINLLGNINRTGGMYLSGVPTPGEVNPCYSKGIYEQEAFAAILKEAK